MYFRIFLDNLPQVSLIMLYTYTLVSHMYILHIYITLSSLIYCYIPSFPISQIEMPDVVMVVT